MPVMLLFLSGCFGVRLGTNLFCGGSLLHAFDKNQASGAESGSRERISSAIRSNYSGVI